jgi:hypothetical protein
MVLVGASWATAYGVSRTPTATGAVPPRTLSTEYTLTVTTRGLFALVIAEAVSPDALLKPCDYFGMIGGTSTGG